MEIANITLEELRKGNLVWDEYSGILIVAATISNEGHDINSEAILLKKALALPSGFYLLKDIKGVPLSGDVLVDLGFHKGHDHNGDTYHILDDNGFTAAFTVGHWNDPERSVSKWHNHWHVKGLLFGHKIQFAHQVQNLFFDLSNRHLIYNPKSK